MEDRIGALFFIGRIPKNYNYHYPQKENGTTAPIYLIFYIPVCKECHETFILEYSEDV